MTYRNENSSETWMKKQRNKKYLLVGRCREDEGIAILSVQTFPCCHGNSKQALGPSHVNHGIFPRIKIQVYINFLMRCGKYDVVTQGNAALLRNARQSSHRQQLKTQL